MIIGALVDMLRPDSQQEKVRTFLEASAPKFHKVVKVPLQKELEDIRLLSNPWDEASCTKRLVAIHQGFQTDANKLLHKSLQVMSTGIALMSEAVVVARTREHSSTLLQELKAVACPDIPVEKELVVCGTLGSKSELLIPKAGVWGQLAESYCKVMAKATDIFKKRCGKEREEIMGKMRAVPPFACTSVISWWSRKA